LSVENSKKQKKIFEKTIKKGLSVREVEDLVRKELSGKRPLKKSERSKDPYVVDMEEDLQRVLGTKVRIDAKPKRGRIIVEYYSAADLERIAEIIKK